MQIYLKNYKEEKLLTDQNITIKGVSRVYREFL